MRRVRSIGVFEWSRPGARTVKSVAEALLGIVGNIQRYCLHDGPGIRTTVFLQGCPLDCWWCHNPENRARSSHIMVHETRCAVCFECARACSAGVAAPAGYDPQAPGGACSLCGRCIETCPTGARLLIGRSISAADLMFEIEKDVVFFDESGGGVTFSGGEPLTQGAFLKEILELCRRGAVHTAVDTCGAGSADDLVRLIDLVDLWLYDLKFVDEQKHIHYTGVSNSVILSNLRLLAAQGCNVWLRIPVIPGVNDTESDLDLMARLAASLPGLARIDLLPYHRTGLAKFQRLGQPYRLPGIAPPTRENLQTAVSRFTALGLNAHSGG